MKKINLLIIPLAIALAGCGKQSTPTNTKINVRNDLLKDALAESVDYVNKMNSLSSSVKLKLTEKGLDLSINSNYYPFSSTFFSINGSSFDLNIESRRVYNYQDLTFYTMADYKGNITDYFKQKQSIDESIEEYSKLIEKDYSGTKYYDYYTVGYDNMDEEPYILSEEKVTKVSEVDTFFDFFRSGIKRGFRDGAIISDVLILSTEIYEDAYQYVDVVDNNTFKFVTERYSHEYCKHPDVRKGNEDLLLRTIDYSSYTITKTEKGFKPLEVLSSYSVYLVEDEKTGEYIDKPILLEQVSERIHDFGLEGEQKIDFPADELKKPYATRVYPSLVDLNTESLISFTDITSLYKLSNKYDGYVYYTKYDVTYPLLSHEFSFTNSKYLTESKFDKFGMDKIDAKNIYVSSVEGSQTKFKFNEEGDYGIRVFTDKEGEITKIEIERIYNFKM